MNLRKMHFLPELNNLRGMPFAIYLVYYPCEKSETPLNIIESSRTLPLILLVNCGIFETQTENNAPILHLKLCTSLNLGFIKKNYASSPMRPKIKLNS